MYTCLRAQILQHARQGRSLDYSPIKQVYPICVGCCSMQCNYAKGLHFSASLSCVFVCLSVCMYVCVCLSVGANLQIGASSCLTEGTSSLSGIFFTELKKGIFSKTASFES